MAERLNIKIQMTMVDAADNSPFFDSGAMTWSGVPYGDAVQFQALLVGVLQQMVAWGQETAKTKGPKLK